jgi:LPS O-antigen subunit length determinant protein (WzzB/FepE family)
MSEMSNNMNSNVRNTQVLVRRVKKDLLWIIISMAVAIVAAAGTYAMLAKV